MLLTRIDPDCEVIEHEDRKGQRGLVAKFVAKNYLVSFALGDTKVALIGLHLLAFPLDITRRFEREAQAEAIRYLAVELQRKGYSLVVFGDFNDYDGSPEARDHIGNRPIPDVLRLIREMDPANALDDLVNVSSFIPLVERFTAAHDPNGNGVREYPGEFTSIDHILLSPELAALVRVAGMPHHPRTLSITDHYPVVVRLRAPPALPVVPPAVLIKVVCLVPNPAGDERQNEAVTLKNLGSQAVDLDGWTLRDRAGRNWSLDNHGNLDPGQEKTIRRNGESMALDNDGDTVELVDASGKAVQTVSYGRAREGQKVVVR